MSTENQEPKKSALEEGSDENFRSQGVQDRGSPGVQDRGLISSESKTKKTDKSNSEKESDEGSRSPGVQDKGV